ncbi:alpha/beta hydrolase [Streptomyces ficellus]|uniref:Alpha/beta hydrolase n=1 Tax=Streptomyces ficellus TaxID=1977088 RepID=A0ABT7YZE2_9ACTN|nr:alpha/beta hydrolase [Streptomyces ficellus]MDN3292582.1 alpha/beta hydrolase [Streptomyces ficellus]
MNDNRPSLPELITAPHPDVAPLPPAAQCGSVHVLRGVPYANVADSRPLELDLWLPESAGAGHGPVPLVLFVHGGAWRRGRRDDMGLRTRQWTPGPFARIAAAGLAVACVDYRLSGEARFPAPLDDLRAALRWLTVRSAELGIDTGRTVVWGESAGGHLASLLALTHAGAALAGPSVAGAALAGAVVWYGPSDLATPRGGYDPYDPATPEAMLVGAAPATVPDRAAAAGPVAQVHPGAPPFLLVHGEEDTMVSCTHSEALAARLKEAGAPVELWTVPGADHGWHGLPDTGVEAIFARSLDFARRVVT